MGKKVKADLLSGNAVVLFAYGLSGSGKTFTVFGPDAVDEDEVKHIAETVFTMYDLLTCGRILTAAVCVIMLGLS